MVPTTGPLQKTLARISVDPINLIHNVTVWVLFNWSCNNDAKYNAVDHGKKLRVGR